MSNIDKTLNERGTRYGDFEDHAFITQDLKAVMQDTPNWDALKADQKEALEMTAHKIGRILNGDPNYIDSWHDIIGYIRLVEQRLEREQAPKDTQKDSGHWLGMRLPGLHGSWPSGEDARYQRRGHHPD